MTSKNKLLRTVSVAGLVLALLVPGLTRADGAEEDISRYSDKYMTPRQPARPAQRTMPLALVMDELVPRDEQWQILLDERLQTRAVQLVDQLGDWRRDLEAIAEANGLDVIFDDTTRTVAVSTDRPSAIALARNAPVPSNTARAPVPGGEMTASLGASDMAPDGDSLMGYSDRSATPPRLMSMDEFNAELVSIDLNDVSVDTALRAALPEGWKVVLPESPGLASMLVSANTEAARRQVLAELEGRLGVQLFPFPNKGVLMVEEARR